MTMTQHDSRERGLQGWKLQQGLRSAEWGPAVILRSNNVQDRMSAWVISRHMRCKKRCPLYPQWRPRKRTSANSHVCFTPESGHVRCNSRCPLWAKSGHCLFDPPFVSRRKKRRIKDIRHAWFCLEFVCQPNLVDRLLQSPNIHATVAVCPHFRRQNIVSDGHTQSCELHLLFGVLIASENRFDRARGTCDRVLQPFEKGTQEASHGLGIFRRKLRIHDDRIAIEFEAMVTHQHDNNVVHRYAAIFKRKIGGKRKSGDGIDLAVGKDRLTRRKSDVEDRYLSDVDPRRLSKDGPLGKSGIPGRRTDLFSFQVFRHRYAAALACDDGAGGLVVDHEYRFERGTSISVTELDKRVDIAEAYVEGARGDAIDRFKRTVSRLDRDFEFFRDEIASVYRD